MKESKRNKNSNEEGKRKRQEKRIKKQGIKKMIKGRNERR